MNKPQCLIDKLIKEDESAQQQLINQFNGRLFLYFRNRIKGEEDYQDLVQEVFHSFFMGVKNNKIAEDQFIAPFIFGIAKRVVFNYFYRKKRNENIQSKLSLEVTFSYDFMELKKLEDDSLTIMITEILDKLPAIDKTIISEFYLNEKNVDQVAKLLNKSNHYVSVRKQRALKKLHFEILKNKNIYNY